MKTLIQRKRCQDIYLQQLATVRQRNISRQTYLTDVLRTRVIRKMSYSWMLRRVTLVQAEVSEEINASIIRATRIGELGTTLALTGNRRRCEEIQSCS
jgi:hypothetical protein